MHKKIFYLILFVGLAIGFCGCDRSTNMILFNKEPITKDNLLNNSSEFVAGKRIYYIFITEKPLNTNMVRIIILKREEKINYMATKIVYSNDFRLYKDQIYYYNDYIVMHEVGYYCMAIYDKNNMEKPIAIADFRVK